MLFTRTGNKMSQDNTSKKVNENTMIVVSLKAIISFTTAIFTIVFGFYMLVVNPTITDNKEQLKEVNKQLMELNNGIGVLNGSINGINNRFGDLNAARQGDSVSGGF